VSAVVPLIRIQEVVVCSGFVGSGLVAFFSACEKGNNYWLACCCHFSSICLSHLLVSFAAQFALY
jgi:hypothetical protein